MDAIIQEDWIKIVRIMREQNVDRDEAEKIFIETRGYEVVDDNEQGLKNSMKGGARAGTKPRKKGTESRVTKPRKKTEGGKK